MLIDIHKEDLHSRYVAEETLVSVKAELICLLTVHQKIKAPAIL